MPPNNLTAAQQGRLARIERESPDAKVVRYEWLSGFLLPHVQRPGFKHRVRIKPDGRTTTVRE